MAELTSVSQHSGLTRGLNKRQSTERVVNVVGEQAEDSDTQSDQTIEWHVAVFCHNERTRIAVCLASICVAMGTRNGLISLIINGSTDGSLSEAKIASAAVRTPVEIFTIDYADKSNAINRFIHDPSMRRQADVYFFVDAYVTINPAALSATAERLSGCANAVAASGFSGNGRTGPRFNKRTVEAGGVLGGQFYAFGPDFLGRMVKAGYRLPIGLYRGDGLLGSMAAHDLDPVNKPWVDQRVIGVAEAVFLIDSLSLFRPSHLRRQFRRKIRQMRGKLENAAISRLIQQGGYGALPAFADDMIRDDLATNAVPAVSLFDRPFLWLALRHHRAASRPATESLRPKRAG